MQDKRILTERLILIPASYEMVISLYENKTEELEKLMLKANSNWPTRDTLDVLGFLSTAMDKDLAITGFDTVWLIIKAKDMIVIGDLGFKGNPNENGEVEIGYGIVEDERQKGYGFEAVKELMNWAFSHNSVKEIKAECLIDNAGSIRILQKVGMQEVSRSDEYIYWKIESPKTEL